MQRMRGLFLGLALSVPAAAMPSAFAADWVDYATVSMTDPVTPKLTNRRLCFTDGTDVLCESPSPYVASGGLIGVGTTNPQTELEVNGTVSATNFVGDGSGLTNINASAVSGLSTDRITSGTSHVIVSDSAGVTVRTNGNDRLTVDTSGNIGIGTGTPGSALEVKAQAVASTRESLLKTSVSDANGSEFGVKNATTTDGVFGAAIYGTGTSSPWNALTLQGMTTSGQDTGNVALMAFRSQIYSGNPVTGSFSNPTTRPLFDWGNNTSTFMLMDKSGNVGIGTTSPQANLQVSGSFTVSTSAQTTTPSLYVGTNGNVGIGTSSPGQKLHVAGKAVLGDTNSTANGGRVLQVYTGNNANANAGIDISRGSNATHGTASSQLSLRLKSDSGGGYWGAIGFANSDTPGENISLLANGNVGIGTTAPSATLHVSGTARITSWTTIAANVAPTTELDVYGTISATGISTAGTITATTALHTGAVCDENGANCKAVGSLSIGSTSAASSTGAIQFNSGSSFAGDTANLYWDDVRNWLGIGTDSVGNALTVIGGISATGSVSATAFYSGDSNAYFYNNSTQPSLVMDTNDYLRFTRSNNTLDWLIGGSPRITIDSTGKLGVAGNSDPQAAIDATGGIVSATTYYGSNGTVSVPSYSFSNDTNSGIYRAAAAVLGFSVGSTNVASMSATGIGTNGLVVAGDVTATGVISASGFVIGANSPAATGAIRYNGTSDTLQVYTGSGWKSLSSATTAGGASALASLTDVNLTNLAGRDYLRYDAGTSKWVNISESTVMSTTTMVSGWPDAIRCSVTSPAIGYRVLYIQEAPYTDGKVIYREPSSQSSTNDRGVIFNSNGSFNSADFYTAHNCNTSISALYAAGQAFNFIGNANASTSTALGDSITSGTLAMTANSATSYISLSTDGTTWGYLQSGGSYLPNISSNYVSASGVSVSGVVQVSGSSLTCSTAIKGAMRYSNTSSAIEYCQGTAWVSMGPSATDVPAFSVNKGGTNQTVTTNTPTKLTFSTEEFDTYNNFDTATSRFTPTITGIYLVQVNVYCTNSTSWCQARIYKNGSEVAEAGPVSGSSNQGHVTALVRMNGSTDYLEAWTYNGGGTTIDGSTEHARFSGSLIASGNGTVGGGSATPAGSSNDVQYNSSGALAADTGNFTYAGGVLTAPSISGTNAVNSRYVSGTQLWGSTVSGTAHNGYYASFTTGSVGSLGVGTINASGLITTTVGLNTTGTVSASVVSASYISSTYVQIPSASTVLSCGSALTGTIRYTSGTVQVCNGSSWGNIGIGVPTGTIMAFAAASCPSGWTPYTPAYGRFLRGIDLTGSTATDPSGTRTAGGTQNDELKSHTHDVTFLRTSGSAGSNSAIKADNAYTSVSNNTNSYIWGGSTGGSETRPKNVAVLYCQYAGYDSALASGITSLDGLSDVTISGASNGQVLTYSGGTWVNGAAPAATAASSTGTIQFNSGNALAGDTSNLFWDDANNRLGVGTNAPTTALQINDNNANTAIAAVGLILRNNSTADYLNIWNHSADTYAIEAADGSTYRNLSLQPHGGNVGIGTTPNAKLDVAGNVSVTGMIDVGHTAQACATAISGSIRYETTSDTLQICTSAGWKSLASSTIASSAIDGSGSAGHVPYWSDADTLTYDSSQLYWDATNNRLSIGATAPTAALTISSTDNLVAIFGAPNSGKTIQLSDINTAEWRIGTGNYGLNFLNDYDDNGTYDTRIFISKEGRLGISTSTPSAMLSLGNNVATGYLDNYSEYQAILYDGGNAAASYGLGIKGNTMVFNSGAGAYSFDRAGGATTMAMDTSGNVGIGTAAPASKLHISGDAGASWLNSALWFTNTGTGTRAYSMGPRTDGNFYIGDETAGVSRIALESGGDVGIGTTNPNAKLEVNGTVSATDVRVNGNSVAVIPTGAIMAFDLTSCPSGWSEYTAARGRFLRGIDNGAGNDPDGTRAPGATQTDAFQGHYHHWQINGQAVTTGGSTALDNNNGTSFTSDGAVTYPVSDGTNGSPRTANETRPKNVSVLFCRKS